MAVSGKGTLFHQAVSSVFKEWQALRIAVDNLFGGPMSKEKAIWMEDVTVLFITNNSDVQKWELEDYLSTLMDQEFNTQIDDASLPEISKKICDLYSYYVSGNTAKVEEYIKRSKPAQAVDVKCVSDHESVDEEECLEDIVEEDNEMSIEGEEREEERMEEREDNDEIIRQRLDQVTISDKGTTTGVSGNGDTSTGVLNIDQDAVVEAGEWETVTKKSKRRSRSKKK